VISVATVETLSAADIDELSAILIAVVNQGASVGWVRRPTGDEAAAYWEGVVQPGNLLLVAREEGQIVGTAQIELAQKANGRHRAEVNKVLVHPDHQRKGIGLRLMRAVEDIARREDRSLLHLDTNSDDVAINLYAKAGYTVAGTIPNFATAPSDGRLHGTTFFYKLLA
jgi:ribosomal protein S18 acetylase RimI-like enzyme